MGKNLLELEQARHFVRWVTREDLSPIDEPDCTRPSRPGGHPDYIFRDSGGREYVLELTRLLVPELRKLEQFVMKRICTAVQSGLRGTYVLDIHLKDARGKGRIDPTVADSTVQEITELAQGGSLGQSHRLRTGLVLTRVRDDGNRLVPWITAPGLPVDLATGDPIAMNLENEFHSLVSEADRKFRNYSGARVLLLNTSQSGLDLKFHAQRFKDSQGVLLTWVQNMSLILTNVDSICLEPSIGVWEANGMQRVMAGHRYIESRAGYYLEVWHRPDIARLLR